MYTNDFFSKKFYNNMLIDAETEHKMIAERAYYKALRRNFTPGHELDDWLEAEQEIRNQSYYWQMG
ncbi:MAG: DUF2934 domain-containing protein [Gammaproteobacteria bacterium]